MLIIKKRKVCISIYNFIKKFEEMSYFGRYFSRLTKMILKYILNSYKDNPPYEAMQTINN